MKLALVLTAALVVIAALGCDQTRQPHPPQSQQWNNSWQQPQLGADPDAYFPNRNRRPCNGPNCPN